MKHLTEPELELIIQFLRYPKSPDIEPILRRDGHLLARRIPGAFGGPSVEDTRKYLESRCEEIVAEIRQEDAFEE